MLKFIVAMTSGVLIVSSSAFAIEGAEGRGGTEIERSRVLRMKTLIEFSIRDEMEDFFRWLSLEGEQRSLYPTSEVKQLIEKVLGEGIMKEIVDRKNGSKIEIPTDKGCIHEVIQSTPAGPVVHKVSGLGTADGVRGGNICLSAYEAGTKNISWQEVIGAGLHEMAHQVLGKTAEAESYLLESFFNLSYEAFSKDFAYVRTLMSDTKIRKVIKTGVLKRDEVVHVSIKFNEDKNWPNTSWAVRLFAPSQRPIKFLGQSDGANSVEFASTVTDLKDCSIGFFGSSVHGGSKVKVHIQSDSGLLNIDHVVDMQALGEDERTGVGHIQALVFRHLM